MRILLDTNIFIFREDDKIVRSDLGDLLRILQELNHQVLIHPLAISEIEHDKNKERKEVIISKIRAYPVLQDPPDPEKDDSFSTLCEKPKNEHDKIDRALLYCVLKDAVDFLITEDGGIHKTAERVRLADRIINIPDAVEYFRKQGTHLKVTTSPPALKYVPIHNLNLNDKIFDSLKLEYPEFISWWSKGAKEGRKAWVHYNTDGSIGALLICKLEDEPIYAIPPLPKGRRVKIATLKVSAVGSKIGELFLKIAIELAVKNGINELYLTHFTKQEDHLAGLIETYGFYKAAVKTGTDKREEDIFIKKLIPDGTLSSPVEIARKFYPSFYDGENVQKFIIPIRPEYHAKLFTEYERRQTKLPEHFGSFIIEGNTIEKAYICHSKIRKIGAGDILLFYRSVDEQKITTVGVVERVYSGLTNPDEMARYVGKRTVYLKEELRELAKKPTKVILFKWHFHFKNPISLSYLQINKLLSGAPQSIVSVSHRAYLEIKKEGGINDSFTVH